VTDETEIITFLKNGTLVGLLPTPHPILIRKFNTGQSGTVWFSAFIWGLVFVKCV
jgi:hypothetical protein